MTAPMRAEGDWPPVVVASVFQTGLNLMRDLSVRGVRAYGVDHEPGNEGFRSVYGRSVCCPNPDSAGLEWVEFMRTLSQRIGSRPVLIPAADVFVSAIGRFAAELEDHFLFSAAGAGLQAKLATKEEQYRLAEEIGFPRPLTAYVRSRADLVAYAAKATFPALLKPRHQREWDLLPVGNSLRGKKVMIAHSPEEMARLYALIDEHRPEVIAQEVIPGPDSSKYCYLAVYAMDGSRLGHCVVREHRCYPRYFGSASVVSPVDDQQIEQLCDVFLRRLGYVGLCEIEVKKDQRDDTVKLIEVNPRFSGTGDCAKFAGVEVGWLHYLDLAGKRPATALPSARELRHVTLRRDMPAMAEGLLSGELTWREALRCYKAPVVFYDFDLRDFQVTLSTVIGWLRAVVGLVLRRLGVRRR